MQAKSFIDILAHELRKEIRAEVEAELAATRVAPAARIEASHKAESVELWLNLKMGGAIAQPNRRSAYQSSRQSSNSSRSSSSTKILQLPAQGTTPTPTQEAVERIGRAVTIEETIALEFFVREGSSLASRFTETELKSEFRKIALRIHPDRHSGASVEQLRSLSSRFQTLVESAEVLEACLN